MKKTYCTPEVEMNLLRFEKAFLTGTYTTTGQDLEDPETFDPFN